MANTKKKVKTKSPEQVQQVVIQKEKLETCNIEFTGKNRPPWEARCPRDWDNVYDPNLGRDIRATANFMMIRDGKPVADFEAKETDRCVAFKVPRIFALKLFNGSPQSFREYDPNVKFVPEKDIDGYKVVVDEVDMLKAENNKLRSIVNEANRRFLSLKQSLGKSASQLPAEIVPGAAEPAEIPVAVSDKDLGGAFEQKLPDPPELSNAEAENLMPRKNADKFEEFVSAAQ